MPSVYPAFTWILLSLTVSKKTLSTRVNYTAGIQSARTTADIPSRPSYGSTILKSIASFTKPHLQAT